jgi:hypothetical protein
LNDRRGYNCESERLKTFFSPTADELDQPTKELLARIGFFHHKGQIRCYFCGKGTFHMADEHDVIDFHYRLSPRCPLLTHTTTDNIALDNEALMCALRPVVDELDALAYHQEIERLKTFDSVNESNEYGLWGEYHQEIERLKTFDSVNGLTLERKHLLACLGFYNTNGRIKCFFCNSITFIPPKDLSLDLVHFHFYLSPNCPLLMNTCTDNVPIDEDILKCTLRLLSDDICRNYNAFISRFQKYPHFATFENRMRSFDDWTLLLNQSKHSFAQAGFFYTGIRDRVECFYCGLKLAEWQPDDVPFIEHARYMLSCEFMYLTIGETKIKHYKSKFENATRFIPRDILQIIKPKPVHITESSLVIRPNSVVDDKYQRRPSSTSSVSECKVCFNKTASVLFTPCNHCSTCSDCSLSLSEDKCPICRTLITHKLKIYFA